MKLIDNAKCFYKMFTIWVGSLATVFGLLPADQQSALLDFLHLPPSRVPALIGLAFILARLIKQPAVTAP